MKRAALAACLLSASNLAAAQQGDLSPGNFEQIFTDSSSRTFVLVRFDSIIGAAMQARESPIPSGTLNPAIFEQHPLVEIEGDGVKLPDKQFTLPQQ